MERERDIEGERSVCETDVFGTDVIVEGWLRTRKKENGGGVHDFCWGGVQ